MDISEDGGQGALETDSLRDLNLDDIFLNESHIENGYLEDNGNVHLGFSAADHLSSSTVQVRQPGVMFCSGQRLLSDGLGSFTGQPIDIPRSLRSFPLQTLPLTPPYSDGPDSPMEDQGSFTTIDQYQLSRMAGHLDSDRFLCQDTIATSAPIYYTHSTRWTCETEPRRKRRRTVETDSVISNPAALGLKIKTEPGLMDDPCHDSDSTESLSIETSESSSEMDTSYQYLKWKPHKQGQWQDLYDENHNATPSPEFKVDADKGFNFSFADDAFVCQKKNHFQVTINLKTSASPKYIKVKEGFKPIDKFKLHLFGIKMESPGSTIKIEQSQADRSKKPYDAVTVSISNKDETKLTVGRLHFSETTSNNMRKKGKPNPDQRYFNLVVAIHAHVKHDNYLICASHSERIIIRASNPGQFENDVEVVWSRGMTPDSVFRMGRVGINTDRPDESLSVHGNMRLTGHVVHPSDMRVKENIEEIDSSEQLRNVSKMKLYRYRYSQGYVEVSGLTSDPDTGVLAQEVKEVLPDAVRESEDVVLSNGQTVEKFLVVNKERIFMENVGAVKELCKLTDKLETRIDELEIVSKKLQKRRRADTATSVFSTVSLTSFSRTDSICSKKSTKVSPLEEEKRKNQHNHNRHRHSCHQQRQPGDVELPVAAVHEQAWCTPRFMQFVIIVLVLVMCLSIAAMATLYVMQDKNSNSSRPNSYDEYTEPRGTTNTSSKSVTTGNPKSPPDHNTPEVTKLSSSPNRGAPVTPTDPKTPGEEITTSEHNTQKSVVPSKHDHKIVTEPEQSKTTTTSNNRCTCCVRNEMCDAAPDTQLAGKPIYYETNNVAKPRGAAAITAPTVPQDFRLTIVEKDFKLICDSCGSTNSSFLVLYSAAAQFKAMTLELNSTASTKMLLCSKSTEEHCPEQNTQPQYDTNIVKDNWSKNHRWRLPSAFYFSSSYHFRIVKPANSSSLLAQEVTCDSKPGSAGSTFQDYFFQFIRICAH